MKRGKRLGVILLAGLLAWNSTLMAKASGQLAKPEVSESQLIRFHVIANSDLEADQNLKLKVRDEILEVMVPALEDSANLDESRRIIRENLAVLEKVAAAKIASEGYSYPVRAELGRFSFPTKTYGGFSLPAGEYEALRVVIGEGAGKNWWCVIFPPLCFVDITRGFARPAETKAVAVAADSSREESLMTADKPQLRFKLWDFFLRIIKGLETEKPEAAEKAVSGLNYLREG